MPVFLWVLGIWATVLLFVQKACCQLNHLSSLSHALWGYFVPVQSGTDKLYWHFQVAFVSCTKWLKLQGEEVWQFARFQHSLCSRFCVRNACNFLKCNPRARVTHTPVQVNPEADACNTIRQSPRRKEAPHSIQWKSVPGGETPCQKDTGCAPLPEDICSSPILGTKHQTDFTKDPAGAVFVGWSNTNPYVVLIALWERHRGYFDYLPSLSFSMISKWQSKTICSHFSRTAKETPDPKRQWPKEAVLSLLHGHCGDMEAHLPPLFLFVNSYSLTTGWCRLSVSSLFALLGYFVFCSHESHGRLPLPHSWGLRGCQEETAVSMTT